MQQYIEYILKGLVSGILAAYLLIYGLRPAVLYPEVILETFENKWLFLVLILINYYLFMWDYRAGAILLLCILALILDYILFANPEHKGKLQRIETSSTLNDGPVFVPASSSSPNREVIPTKMTGTCKKPAPFI